MKKYKLKFTSLFLFMILLSVGSVTFSIQHKLNAENNGIEIFKPSDYTEHDTILIESNEDFATEGWPGMGTPDDPFIIEGISISDSSSCIEIDSTNVSFVIRNCFLTITTDYGKAIELSLVMNGAIENCTIISASVGIRLYHSKYCTLEDNTIERSDSSLNTYAGISIWGFTIEDYVHQVAGNLIDGKPLGYFLNHENITIDGSGYHGLYLLNSTDVTVYYANGCFIAHCENCAVVECDTTWSRLWLYHSEYCSVVNSTFRRGGIFLDHSDFSMIVGNWIYGSSDKGISVHHCYECTIANNTIYGIKATGIYFENGEFCTIYGNKIGWNSQNAWHKGWNNLWNHPSGYGNSWSDYNGSGSYPIYGYYNDITAYDDFPSVWTDETHPTIDSPSDVIITEGTSGKHITWHASDTYHLSYKIILNHMVLVEELWSHSEITFSLDDLWDDTFNITLLVSDGAGNTAVDCVNVTVLSAVTSSHTIGPTGTTSPSTPTTSSPDAGLMTVVVLSGAIGVVVIVIVVFKRRS